MSLSGWIILDKPLGKGSTSCVGWVKRALKDAGEAKTKVGHGGTLDPLATGVLPIALGEATKFAGRMLDATKAYDFTIRFGAQTDTLDLEGKVIAESAHRPTLAEIEAVLPRFTGPIEQVPPAFSALKVDGQRAYALARAGIGPWQQRVPLHHPADGSPPHQRRWGGTQFDHPLRHRLQGHLRPQPRARHCAGAWHRRSRHHVAANQGRTVHPRTGDIAGLSGPSR